MAKARSRTQARKIKDRWKAKKWFNILAPASFDNATIAETLTSNPDLLIDRVTEITMQDLTNDFRKSHILLYFKIHELKDDNAHTQFVGHSLTSDYLRRMIRRRRSKIEGVYDVQTRDGAKIRVKPFATTDKRIQNSQKRVVRESMKKTIQKRAKTSTLSEFIKIIIEGKLGSEIYKNCKKLYPVKRVEIFKTQVNSQPTREIKEEKPKKTEEKPKETEEKADKTKKDKKEKEEKKDESKDKPEEPKEEAKVEKEDKESKDKKEEKTKKKEKKTKAKKTTTKKTATKKKATTKKKKAAKKKTTTKKKTAKKE